MPPSPAPPIRPIPLAFLERIARPLLARLLSAHAPHLLAESFPLDALAASAQTDRAHVATLWRLLSAPPPSLAPLHEALLALADLATPAAHEILLARDTAQALDRDLGTEDCAVTAYLDHRALFEVGRAHGGQAQAKVFASFEAQCPRPLPDDPACAAHFAHAMSKALEARSRTDHFRVHEWRSGEERHMELRYGRLASARDLLGKTSAGAHDVTKQVTDRSTESAHAIFHDDTMRLDVSGPEWMKELVRSQFGESYFGSEDHFEQGGRLTLDPLADLETTLATHGVPELARVHLREVWVDLGDDSGWVAVGSKGSCRNGLAGGYALRIVSDGRPVQATFSLFLAGKTRPIGLTIVTPGKLSFDRRDPRVVRIVRAWVVAAGFMRLPEIGQSIAAASAEEPSPASVASVPSIPGGTPEWA